MRDDQLEDRLRAVLRAEGDSLPLTITPEELERRLSARRRGRVGRRMSLAAAGIAAALLVGLGAVTNGWLRVPTTGSSPAPTGPSDPASKEPSIPALSDATPTSSQVVVAPDTPCAALEPSSSTRTPDVVLDVHPNEGPSSVHSGQLGAFRLAGRDVGSVGSWDHDTITFDAARAASWPSGITVLAVAPDTCLTGVAVDAVPYDSVPATTPATVVDIETSSEPQRLLGFSPPPVGDWFVRVHAEFQTTDGSEAFSETFFRILVEEATREPEPPGECAAVDPTASAEPPVVIAGTSPGDSMGFGGRLTAFEWAGVREGTSGSWSHPDEPEWIRIDPANQRLDFIADGCMLDVAAEALLTRYAAVPADVPPPLPLEVIEGGGSRIARVESPSAGGWLVRLRATFATTDGTEAWSETLFPVMATFHAPSLTLRDDAGRAVSAAAGCTSYELASGAAAADACGAPYVVNPAAVVMPVGSAMPVELALSEGWEIDEARVVAVDAGLVAAGDFAPEHSVHFTEGAGGSLGFPVALEPGSWILRVSLNGHRGDDRFGAHYDVSIEVTT